MRTLFCIRPRGFNVGNDAIHLGMAVAIEDGTSFIVAVPELESPSGVKGQGATGRQTYLLLTPHQHLPARAATAD